MPNTKKQSRWLIIRRQQGGERSIRPDRWGIDSDGSYYELTSLRVKRPIAKNRVLRTSEKEEARSCLCRCGCGMQVIQERLSVSEYSVKEFYSAACRSRYRIAQNMFKRQQGQANRAKVKDLLDYMPAPRSVLTQR